MRFWKLNLYPFLLSLFLLGIAMISVYAPVLHDRWWKVMLITLSWMYGAEKTLRIFCNYGYKVQTLEKLVAKGRKRYDPRYYIPYMDSPCMRSVVWLALCDIGKQADYRTIKMRSREKHFDGDFQA